jgi:hypothetical protein
MLKSERRLLFVFRGGGKDGFGTAGQGMSLPVAGSARVFANH